MTLLHIFMQRCGLHDASRCIMKSCDYEFGCCVKNLTFRQSLRQSSKSNRVDVCIGKNIVELKVRARSKEIYMYMCIDTVI